MVTKSDIMHIESKFEVIHELGLKLDKHTDTVNKLIIQHEKKVESDKHRDKDVARAIKLGEENKEDIGLLKQKDAANAPYIAKIKRAELIIIGFIVTGVLGAAVTFIANK